jgi:putative membrane protein insertion efficiency factor
MVKINFLKKVKSFFQMDFFQIKDKFGFVLINKRIKKFVILIVRFYQIFFSYLLRGYECRFHPTCSNYMIEAIEKKGLIKGVLLGIWRILNCHPFSKKDRDYPVNTNSG